MRYALLDPLQLQQLVLYSTEGLLFPFQRLSETILLTGF